MGKVWRVKPIRLYGDFYPSESEDEGEEGVKDDTTQDGKKVERPSQRPGIAGSKRERSNPTITCSSPSLTPAATAGEIRSSVKRGTGHEGKESRDVVNDANTVSPMTQTQVTQSRLTDSTSSANATERRNTNVESDPEVAHATAPADSGSESLSYSKPRKNPKRYAICSPSHLANRCGYTGSDFDALRL
jgi:hypothetical protein